MAFGRPLRVPGGKDEDSNPRRGMMDNGVRVRLQTDGAALGESD